MQRKNLDDPINRHKFDMMIIDFISYTKTSSETGITTVGNSIISVTYPNYKHKLTFTFADGIKNTLWLPEDIEPYWTKDEPKTNAVLSPTSLKEAIKKQIIEELYTNK